MNYFYTTFIVFILLALSGLFSGLTLGLLSLSPFELKRKGELGDAQAKRVYPIRQKGNQLLVTLLVGNVLVNSALTVVLNSFQSGLVAIIVSTTLITIFGEILPQSFLNKHGLAFGAKLAPLINWLMLIFSPVALPLSKLVDRLVGSEAPDIYSKDELVKIVEEHERSEYSDVEEDELRIVENALHFGDRLIKDIMTPRSKIYYINSEEIVDNNLLKKLHKSGYSRFPVIENDDLNQVIGMLYIRDMILLSDKKLPAKEVDKNSVLYVSNDQLLDRALNRFIKTKQHLFVVRNSKKQTVGVVSMEDILEEIIGEEIVDEFDR